MQLTVSIYMRLSQLLRQSSLQSVYQPLSIKMSTSSTTVSTGVVIPTYAMLPPPLLPCVDHAASVNLDSTDEVGEFYAMALLQPLLAAQVPDNAIIAIPLLPPPEDQPLDMTYVAATSLMFVHVHEKPQTRMTYGHVAGYSAGTVPLPIPVSTMVKFPSAASFLVAKPRLIAAEIASVGPEVDVLVEAEPKRQCLRQPVSGGELADDAGEKQKGTSTYLLDLDGVKHPTRNKTDIAQRERDLYFVFRAMDPEKLEYSISTDLVLQPELYRSMVCEQGDTQSDDRHSAFMSCGLISRVQNSH